MKKIALFGYEDKTENYKAVLEYLGCEVIQGLDKEKAKLCDALLIPGGGDVDPHFYNEEINGSVDPNTDFDKLQLEVLDFFIKNNKPVLGICRGMQLINVYFGGSLYQDLKNKEAHIPLDEVKKIDNEHSVRAQKGSFFEKTYGEVFRINSWHHQGIKKLADKLVPLLFSDDEVIEAVESKEHKLIAVQFHPERMSLEFKKEGLADGVKIFEYFIALI